MLTSASYSRLSSAVALVLALSSCNKPRTSEAPQGPAQGEAPVRDPQGSPPEPNGGGNTPNEPQAEPPSQQPSEPAAGSQQEPGGLAPEGGESGSGEPEGGEPGGEEGGAPVAPQQMGPIVLQVYVAPSLTGALTELGRRFAEAHPGTTVRVTGEPFYEALKRMGDDGGDVLVPEGYTALEAARAAGIAKTDGAVTVDYLPLAITVAGPIRDQITDVKSLEGRRVGVPDGSSSTAGEAARRLIVRARATGVQERVMPGNPTSALKDGTLDAYISWGRVTEAGVPLSVPIELEELLPIPAVVSTLTRHDALSQEFVNWLTEDAARRVFEQAGGVPTPEAGRRRAATVLPVRLPGPRRSAGSAIIGAKILLVGGEAGGVHSQALTWVEPATYRVHDAMSKLSAPRRGAAAAHLAAASGVYILGGHEATGVVATIERFEPSSDTMITLETTLPRPLEGAAEQVISDKLYLFGGFDDTGAPLDSIIVFDAKDGRAVALDARLPAAVGGMAAAPGPGASIWLFGGRDARGPVADVVIFDALTGTATRSNIRMPEANTGLGVVPWTDGWLLVGGQTARGLTDSLTVLSQSGTSKRLDVRLPEGLADAAVVLTGEQVHVLGGTTDARIESRIIRLLE